MVLPIPPQSRGMLPALGLCTAFGSPSVAVCDTTGKITSLDAKFELGTPNGNDESLDSMARELLSKVGIRFAELKLLLVGEGPGSFTGLRIGYAWAYGVALANRVPLLSRSSLDALAAVGRNEAKLVVALSDARREEFFFAVYTVEAPLAVLGGEPARIGTLDLIHQEVEAHLRRTGLNPSDVLFVAPEAAQTSAKYRNATPELLKSTPRGAALLAQLLGAGEVREENRNFGSKMAGQVVKTVPNYLRAVSAKTIAERQQK